MVIEVVLWGGVVCCLLAVGYTYLGYPLLLTAVTRGREPPGYETAEEWPSVAMVIAAHNEETVISKKLENVAATDYPGPFECMVVSDSTDGTDDVVREQGGQRVSLLSLSERRGKSYALNQAVARTDADVIVFSDANTMYEPDAVRELVAPFGDSGVGCTTGRLTLYDSAGETAESGYWRYELLLRRMESRLGTTVGINGGVLAIRREDYDPLPESALTDDFVVAVRQLVAGQRVVYVPSATAAEETTGGLWTEFDRRVRIGTGNYQTLAWYPALLSPSKGIVALQYVSHKVLRWVAPGILLSLMALSLALVAVSGSIPAVGLLGLELFGGGLALLGSASERARRTAVVRYPAYFLVMNLAFAVGFVRFLAGPSVDVWKATRS